LSIPRDTCVSINGSDEKIGMVCAKYGTAMAVNTVSSLINANIKYHIYVDTACVEKMIDLLDGIEFDIPNDMHYDDPSQNLTYIYTRENRF
jgi:anionic cell wall polymer biosynthesis LytR-Cps2A-Psr (LCP) family protein